MARERLPALSSRDRVVPIRSDGSATAPAAIDGLVAESSPYWRPDFHTHSSEFQSVLSRVVELAKILTGANGSAIAFRGEQGTICRARAGQGAPPIGALVDASAGISRQCLDTGTPLRCDDIRTDDRVDPDVSQVVSTRALAVVPIYSDGAICGILEVFSSIPGSFTDQHLKTLEHLANLVASQTDTPSEEPIAGPCADVQHNGPLDFTLLVEREPLYRTFFQNLADLLSPTHLERPSSQMHEWNDVLIDSHLPWKRFGQSVLLHLAVVGMTWGLSTIWPRELLISPRPLREAQITYYPVSQSFPARGSRPPVADQKQPRKSVSQQIMAAVREHALRVASENRGASMKQKPDALTAPPPALAISATVRPRKPELGAATSVLPPAVIDGAQARLPHLPALTVVAPPPEVRGGAGSRSINAPGAAVVPPPDVRSAMTSAGLVNSGKFGSGRPSPGQLGVGSGSASDISIVPPPPSINDHPVLTYGAGSVSTNGEQVVGPPPSVQPGSRLGTRGGAISLGTGGSQVVAPPPSIEGAGNSVGRGRGNSLAGGGSQVIPPAPSIQGGEGYGSAGRANSAYRAGAQVVPPPPSVDGHVGGSSVGGGRSGAFGNGGSQVVPPSPALESAGNSVGGGGQGGRGGRASALALLGADTVSPPGSVQGGSNGESGVAKAAGQPAASSETKAADKQTPPAIQEVQLRVISAAWAPPRSSYFSNYEVYVAEKWLNKEAQLIKLVYEFLPYQRRLSEYGLDTSKVRKLRVTRDPTCDESLMQIEWPENGGSGSGSAPASNPDDRNNKLPCYRTTADDYRRAVLRSQ